MRRVLVVTLALAGLSAFDARAAEPGDFSISPVPVPAPRARDPQSADCAQLRRLDLLIHKSLQQSARIRNAIVRLEREVRRCRSGRRDGPLGAGRIDCAGLGIERLSLRDRLLAERIKRDKLSDERAAIAKRIGATGQSGKGEDGGGCQS